MAHEGYYQRYHLVLKELRPRPDPPFHAPALMERVWGRVWGVRNDVDPLRVVVLHRPGDEVRVMEGGEVVPELGARLDRRAQWYWRDPHPPDLGRLQAQHDALAAALRAEGVEVLYLPGAPPADPKMIYTRDVAFAAPGGVIVGRMGTMGDQVGGRRGEEALVARFLAGLGVPILHTVCGRGLFEGGSLAFLSESVAAIGTSYRQNEEGVRQVEGVLAEAGVSVVRVPLVGYALHLDEVFVMLDRDLAVANLAGLPHWFLDYLERLGIEVVPLHPDDEPMAVNCIATGPRQVIMATGGRRTAEALRRRGCRVQLVEYGEVHKAGGGIHCSTLPLVRAA